MYSDFKGGISMVISEELIKAVQEGDKIKVKVLLKNRLLIDLGRDVFQAHLEYAKRNMPSLIVEHDGEVLKNPEEWTDDYANIQLAKLITNFSLERIDLLVRMLPVLDAKKTQIQFTNSDNNAKKSTRTVVRRPSTKREAGLAMCVLGTIAAATGIMLKTSIAVPIIGGAAVVAGVAMCLTDEEEK